MARARGTVARVVTLGLLGLLGAASGASAAADGFYDLTVWGPIGVALLALAFGLVLALGARPRLLPALAVGGLAGLWAWSLLSTTWAESQEQALVVAGRFALYAAFTAAVLMLLRRPADRWIPLAFAATGILGVALYVLLHMLDGGADLFFGGRLRDPLGYVNGQAGYFLLGFWPFVALAEQSRSKLLAGVGAASALVLGALLMLSQTRGVIPSLLVSTVVMLLVVPGRARRVWVLAAVGIGLFAISGALLDVYRELPDKTGTADPQRVKEAARAVLPAALVVGAGWTAAQFLFSAVAGTGAAVGRTLLRAEAALAVVAVLLVAVAASAALGDPVDRVDREYDDFVNLRVDTRSDTRFLSGGGYRYDYWRVAWREFKDQPLRGLGGGNYDRFYFLKRRTNEDIQQPHSLPLQVLAELGIVGALFLLAFVGAVAAGLWRTARRGLESPYRRALAVAGGGAFVAWLMHTSLDWLHNLPGVTGVALCAAATLLAPWSRRGAPRGLATSRIVVVVLVAAAALVAADSLGRLALADKYRIDGRSALRSDPIEALRLANRSLAFESESLPALYIKSAAYARLNRYRKARASLREARRLEPHDPLPWFLLGDLAARRGRLRLAKRYYRRASELDPKNDLIKGFAKDPGSALSAKR
jgi:hypothetical protein